MPAFLITLLEQLAALVVEDATAAPTVDKIGGLLKTLFPQHAPRIAAILPLSLPTDDEAAKLDALIKGAGG